MAIIGVHTDCFGSITNPKDKELQQENEMDLIISIMQNHLKGDHTYIKIFGLHEMKNHSFDVFIVDFGGLTIMGGSGMITSYHRHINRYIEDHPSCKMVFWSDMAVKDYVCYMVCVMRWFFRQGMDVLVPGSNNKEGWNFSLGRIQKHLDEARVATKEFFNRIDIQ